MVVLCVTAALAQPPSAEQRGKPFWLALARECTVPAGESAFGLVSEALSSGQAAAAGGEVAAREKMLATLAAIRR
jgi:hypothetical protein